MINEKLPQVVIMAGGLGTRISTLNNEVPKPMIPINGFPILYYQIENLKKYDLRNIILVVGYKAEKISEYFGDGSKFGVKIKYVIENNPLGTAGSFYYLKKLIKTKSFILLNGDIIFNIDFNRFIEYFNNHNVKACICTHPNSHPFDSSLIETNKDGIVTNWYGKDERPEYYQNQVNAGIHILSTELLYSILKPEKHNLDNEILKPLVKTSNLLAYDTPEYIKDMGTPERYYQVVADINSGVMQNKNLSLKQRAAFIDRDGTINKYVGFLKNINDFELLPNVSNAIKLLNKLGYLVIVVTNQPVIARGDVTESELKTIHNKMETLLGNDGAYVDAIYYCPHHPDSGYPGEIKELKIKCHCRKPDTGLIEQAQRDFNIDINNSFIIGDSSNDMQLANNLNIPFYKVDYENDLLQCVERRIEDEKSRIIR
ncbi:MAG: HAD-IIIA family hydrolase [Bacilli bacterium]|nr:HAD-IIIA family hydrolase [Bacilli bacterium]